MRILGPPNAAAAAVGAVCGWSIMTPSLLPRGPVLQGLVCGLAGALGYGVAVGILRLWAALRRGDGNRAQGHEQDRSRRRRLVASVVAPTVVGTAVMAVLWLHWQRGVRPLMGMGPPGVLWPLWVILVAAAVAVVLVVTCRCIGTVVGRLDSATRRSVPGPVRLAGGLVVLVALVLVVVSGATGVGIRAGLDVVFGRMDRGTDPGVEPPSSSLRSGGPGSEVAWEDLGQDGRTFVATGPGVREIREFGAGPATEPIRVFAGLRSADGLAAEADLVVDELDRTGAWDREVVVVYTAAAAGLVDPAVADSIELMWAGDTAVASMQYSFLPSWLSFLFDGQAAREAGRALIDAVRNRWTELPEGSRPRLVVFGESLGVYGAESAFDDAAEVVEHTDGAFFVGPPFMSPIWGEVMEDRESGSPVWLPVFDGGRHVRAANGREELRTPFRGWERRRVLYLEHGSDPVTWWSPSLLWSRPQWLSGERAPDVSDDIVWVPGLTFLQTTVDLANAQSVPNGHGHRFGATVADGWAAVIPPGGWTQADTDRLHARIGRR